MDERRYRTAGGGLMLVAAGLVVTSLQVDHVSVLGASVPVLMLAVGVYLLGVAAIAPVHLRDGEHRRLLANVLIGVGVILLAWSNVDGPELAAAAGIIALIAGGAFLYLAGQRDEGDEGPDATAGESTDSTDGTVETPATEH